MEKDEAGVMHFATQEEVNELLENGDAEVTQAIIDGMVIIDGAVKEVEPEEDVIETQLEVDEAQPEEVEPKEQESIPEAPDFSEELANATSSIRNDFEEQLRKERAEREALLKTIEELKQLKQEPVKEEPEQELNIQLEDEDPDLETEYAKNTRRMIEALKSSNSGSTEQAAHVKELEQKLETFLSNQEAERKAKEAERNRKALYKEIDEFSKGKPQIEIPIGIGDAREEQYALKEGIAKAFNIDIDARPGDVETIYRRIAAEDSVLANKQRAILKEKDVEIPDYTKNYLNLITLYERKNGTRFNPYTGKKETITDAFGNTSVLASVEEAYKLSPFYQSEQGQRYNDASLEVQKRLQEQQETVATIDNSTTSDVSGSENITEEDFTNLMMLDKQALLSNPMYLRQYGAAMTKMGMKVPADIAKALSELDK